MSDPRAMRVYPRVEVKAEVAALLEFDGGIPIRATVKDLSRGGIGLLSRMPLSEGREFVISVTMGPRAIRARCRVANCRGNGCGGYFVGIEFLDLGEGRERERRIGEIREKLEQVIGG